MQPGGLPNARGDPPPIGSVGAVTTAVAVVDRLADAIGWAVEIGQFVESAVDAPMSVYTDVFGTMGTLTWILVQPDFAAADAARAKLVGNADYLKQISGSKDLLIQGSGHVGQAIRIA